MYQIDFLMFMFFILIYFVLLASFSHFDTSLDLILRSTGQPPTAGPLLLSSEHFMGINYAKSNARFKLSQVSLIQSTVALGKSNTSCHQTFKNPSFTSVKMLSLSIKTFAEPCCFYFLEVTSA